ncbi:hypothetical protein Avbf_08445 [Armadillidium vulgare]|nr:hypothetical protein Avbf_08445 [Armadillidium vulgare]
MPALSDNVDPVWSYNDTGFCTSKNKIEEILASVVSSYRELLFKANKFSIVDFDNIMDVLLHKICLLIEKSAEISKSKRWTEEKEKLETIFSNIRKGDFLTFSENCTDIIRIESEFRADLVEHLLSKEIRSFDASFWDLKVLHQCEEEANPKDVQFEEYDDMNAMNILKFMRDEQKQICWIIGEHGVGKSSFSSYVSSMWAQKAQEIVGLSDIGFVYLISASIFEKDADVFSVLFPLSSLVVEKTLLESCLWEKKMLFIIDDIGKDSEILVKKLYALVEKFPCIIIWLLGRHSTFLKYAKESSIISSATLLELKGLKENKILELSKNHFENKSVNVEVMLKKNMNRLGFVLKYPTITFMTFKLLQGNENASKNIYTGSDLMWEILCWEVKQTLKVNIKKIGPARKKFLDWLMLAGELSLYCLKADLRLDNQSYEELESEITSLYKDNGKIFLGTIFKPSIVHSTSSCFSRTGSTNKPFLEYLSSWFFIDQLLQDKQIKQLINGLVNPLPLILLAAGHLERFQDEGSITIPEERKVIRSLVTYKENSFEDFSFIQKFVAELKCIKRLVQIVIDETEYNEEWNLSVPELQHKPLEVLLNHVSPTRLILLVDKLKENYELNDVISFICRVDISVWLDSLPQFTYGNSESLDALLQPFLGEYVVPKVDLISGSLSSSMIRELSLCSSTRHLVLLRLKVSNNENLNTSLSVSKGLQNLLWLELKIDMKFEEIEMNNIEKNVAPLFDLHLRHIKETDVPFVTDFLTKVSSCYTGIHLEETVLTPEGVYALLKELNKKGISLQGDKESIDKFRLWYYPSLSSLPKWRTPTEEECFELIGHDDRDFFSDHYVVSSRFVTTIDAWNLRNYLEMQQNILHFVYEASNIIFTKCLDGHVQIQFKGDYKETIEEKILSSGFQTDKSKKSIENHILEFY